MMPISWVLGIATLASGVPAGVSVDVDVAVGAGAVAGVSTVVSGVGLGVPMAMGSWVGVGAGIPSASSLCSRANSLSGRPTESVTGESSMVISRTIRSLSSREAIFSAKALRRSSSSGSAPWARSSWSGATRSRW